MEKLEVTVNMQEVSYGRIMRELNLTGNLTYTQSPHVSTCSRLMQDMQPVLPDPSSPLIFTKGGGRGRVCTQVTRHAVVLDQSVFHAVAYGFLVSGFFVVNSGYLSPGNPDFESNNNPYRLTWGDTLSHDRFRLVEKSLQQTFFNPYGRHRPRNAVGHFRVPPGLCIKTRLSVQPLIWK